MQGPQADPPLFSDAFSFQFLFLSSDGAAASPPMYRAWSEALMPRLLRHGRFSLAGQPD